MKYKVKEYIGSFVVDPEDVEIDLQFPTAEFLRYEAEVECDGPFDPYAVGLAGLRPKYAPDDDEVEDFKNELSVFDYFYDEVSDIHYLHWQIDDGENVDLIEISIQKINLSSDNV